MTKSFEVPLKVVALLTNFDRPWFVAGGWAIDLYLGRVTRDHKDIEIAILRKDQKALREHLNGWKFEKVIPSGGGRVEPWYEGEWLKLPAHEIHAQRLCGDLSNLEILLNESSGDKWQFRRNMQITRSLLIIRNVLRHIKN